MIKIVPFVIGLLLLSVTGYTQTSKRMLAELEGKYRVDEGGNVNFERVIEIPGLAKDEIYTRALAYFISKYSSGPDIIAAQDKETGTIVGKGKFKEVFNGYDPDPVIYDANHTLQVDTKEGRARIIVSLSYYEQAASGSTGYIHLKQKVSNSYPVNPRGSSKPRMIRAFYDSYLAATNALNGVERAIRGTDKDKW